VLLALKILCGRAVAVFSALTGLVGGYVIVQEGMLMLWRTWLLLVSGVCSQEAYCIVGQCRFNNFGGRSAHLFSLYGSPCHETVVAGSFHMPSCCTDEPICGVWLVYVEREENSTIEAKYLFSWPTFR
jgi:hypothetical protein